MQIQIRREVSRLYIFFRREVSRLYIFFRREVSRLYIFNSSHPIPNSIYCGVFEENRRREF